MSGEHLDGAHFYKNDVTGVIPGNYAKAALVGHQIQCRDVKLKKNEEVGLGVIVYGRYLEPVDNESENNLKQSQEFCLKIWQEGRASKEICKGGKKIRESVGPGYQGFNKVIAGALTMLKGQGRFKERNVPWVLRQHTCSSLVLWQVMSLKRDGVRKVTNMSQIEFR